jgi:sporulation protein YlmC with PRC-barrel domain
VKRNSHQQESKQMKVQALTMRAAVVAALVLGSSQWLQAQNTSSGDKERSWGSERSGSERTTTQSTTGQPMNFNKASSLIGMAVVNPQGEKLGKVKDIVIDLNGDRVSYVVLSTGTSILSSEKLHAVPLQAFRPDSAGNELILNADKNKMEQAQGFDKNSWPSLNSTSWGAEPFWKAPTTGTSGQSGTSSGTSGHSPYGEPDSGSSGESGR